MSGYGHHSQPAGLSADDGTIQLLLEQLRNTGALATAAIEEVVQRSRV